MSSFRVVLDASVLYPIVKTDILLHLAEEELYVPLWSSEIEKEAIRALMRTGRISGSAARHRFQVMDSAFPHATVRGWEPLVDAVHGLPDPNDRHVVAACLKGGSSTILTENLKDFPTEVLDPFGIEALSTNEFLLDLLDLDEHKTITAIAKTLHDRKNPPLTAEELLAPLRQDSNEFVATVLRLLEEPSPSRKFLTREEFLSQVPKADAGLRDDLAELDQEDDLN